jgi:hypothetical protein
MAAERLTFEQRKLIFKWHRKFDDVCEVKGAVNVCSFHRNSNTNNNWTNSWQISGRGTVQDVHKGWLGRPHNSVLSLLSWCYRNSHYHQTLRKKTRSQTQYTPWPMLATQLSTECRDAQMLTHWGWVTQICVITLQLRKTDDANLRF